MYGGFNRWKLVIELILLTNIFKDYLKHKVYLLENFSSIDCAW